jgi:hypothetical protein
MPGPPVTIGCNVILTPGATGPPDTGTIVGIIPPVPTAGGMPLATAASICLMVNSASGAPYPALLGSLASSGVSVTGRALVRLGDQVPTPPGVMSILGPPAALFVMDQWPP